MDLQFEDPLNLVWWTWAIRLHFEYQVSRRLNLGPTSLPPPPTRWPEGLGGATGGEGRRSMIWALRPLLDWLEPLPLGLFYSRALRGLPPPPSWSRRERAARVSKQPEPGKSSCGHVRVLQGSGGDDAGLSSYVGVNAGVSVPGGGEPSAWSTSAPSRRDASLPGLLPPPPLVSSPCWKLPGKVVAGAGRDRSAAWAWVRVAAC